MSRTKPPVNVGDLFTVALAQKPFMVSDSMGGQITEWVDDYEFYAEINPVKGSETTVADKLEAANYYLLWARWDPRLTESHRVVCDELTMNIRSISNYLGRRQWMDIRCESGVGS